MPTTYRDQFWLIDPSDPPPVGTVLQDFSFDIIDQNDNGLITAGVDSIDGSLISQLYPGDTVTVMLASGATVTITGATAYLADGRVVFTPTDGSVLETATLTGATFVPTQNQVPIDNLGPPCFVSGTMIGVRANERLIETLGAGDIVMSYDGHASVLRKVIRRSFTAAQLRANSKLRPVRITAGALGNGLPTRDLLVSRQHRMLVKSRIAERMFGQSEVLVAAIKLTALPGIFIDDSVETVEYFHLLFDKHEIILAEGAPSESLFTGQEALKSISHDARQELLTIFPELAQPDHCPDAARFIPVGKQQKQLVERHLKNKRTIIDAAVPQSA